MYCHEEFIKIQRYIKDYIQLDLAQTDLQDPTFEGGTGSGAGDVLLSNETESSIDVAWEAAFDNETPDNELYYKLYFSLNQDIQTLADIQANGTLIAEGANLLSFQHINLASAQQHCYNYTVEDNQGNIIAGTMNCTSTLAPAPEAEYQIDLSFNLASQPSAINLVSESFGAILQTGGGDFDVEVEKPAGHSISMKRSYWNTFDSGQAAIDETFATTFEIDDIVSQNGVNPYQSHNISEPITIPANTDGNCGGAANETISGTVPAIAASGFASLDAIGAITYEADGYVGTPSNSALCNFQASMTFIVRIKGLNDVFNIRDNIDPDYSITVTKIS